MKKMLLLDFLFNICYVPFRNTIKGGRFGALFILTPSLTFIISGAINFVFYKLKGAITQSFNPLVLAVGMLFIFYSVFSFLNKTYVKNNRDVYHMKYPTLYIILLPVFFIGSIILFGFTVSKFG